MGPPREHGGMQFTRGAAWEALTASMGPPREHGGMNYRKSESYPPLSLQWGRRVNTAE